MHRRVTPLMVRGMVVLLKVHGFSVKSRWHRGYELNVFVLDRKTAVKGVFCAFDRKLKRRKFYENSEC